MKSVRKVIGSLIVLLIFPPLSKVSAAPVDPPPRYNLFVIVLNTFNRNHVSLYGYPKKTMPNLEGLASDSYVFTNLVSPTSFTFPVLQGFFKAGPYGPDFYLADPWHHEYENRPLYEYPLPKFILSQGYSYVESKFPDRVDRPFFAFLHMLDLHYPYDYMLRLESRLTPKSRKLYRRFLKENTIRLVDKLPRRGPLPEDLPFITLGIRATEIPVADAKVWNELLLNLKETGSSPTAIVAAGLPIHLKQRLARVTSAESLTLRDKKEIVRALNDLVCRADSPIGKILFDPGSIYARNESPTMHIGSLVLDSWAALFVYDISAQLEDPEPFLTIRETQLNLAGRLDQRQSFLLRRIYREALEAFLPSLRPLHSQAYSFRDAFITQEAWRKSPGYADEMALVNELYDAKLSEVDQKIGGALDRLNSLGVLDKTIVVVMGDHGEGLMEHDYFEHTQCYDEMINPPLVIRVPGRLKETRIVKTQLRTCDILPTLVGFMGLKPPPYADPPGINLVPYLSGRAPEPDLVAISRGDKTTPLSIRRNDGWKLILDMPSGSRKLYNRIKDAAEQHNVAEENPAVTAKLEEELNHFLHGE